MKKTKKTMYTAALLSAAVALQSEIGFTASEAVSPQPAYGPPSYFYRDVRGDLNNDSRTDIVDYILMKANASKGSELTFDEEMLGDLNEDNQFTPEDIRIFERYLFGKIPSVRGKVYSDDYDDNPSVLPSPLPSAQPTVQPVYGAPAAPDPTPEPDVTASEEPLQSELPQTKYGPPVTEITEEQVMTTLTTTTVPVYGPPSAFGKVTEDINAATDDPEEPQVSVIPEPMPTVYGPPPGYIYSDPEEPQVSVIPEPMPTVYGPPPGYIYSEPEEPQFTDNPSVVYGPPSWFEKEK